MRRTRGTCRFVAAGIFAATGLFLTRPTAAAEAAAAHYGPAIWRVRTNESTVYLFGSMHILPAGFVWATKRIEDAMSASNRFIFEVPIGNDTVAVERDFILR